MSQLRLKLQGADSSQAFSTRGVFSRGYLLRHLRGESEHFASAADAEHVYNFARDLWAENYVAMRKRGEAFTCSKFIEPLLQKLGWAVIPQESMPASFHTRKRPDYCLFLSEDEQRAAAEEESSQNLFRRSATVLEAKAAEHPLDRVSQRETPGWFPSEQVQDYLHHARDSTGRRFFDWAILTNGNLWRLYSEHAAPDAYFEFELAEGTDLCAAEEFRIFLTLFRPQAFTRREDEKCFLDDVREQSLRFQADLETNLRKRIFDVLEDLATAYAEFEPNNISEKTYGELYSTSLIFLYRLLFILYAESRGLLPVKPTGAGANRRYRDRYSLARLVERLRDKTQFDSNAFTDLYEQLLKLFDLINGTHPKQNEECGVTQYNGGLFKPEAHPLIQKWRVGDRALANVLRQLIFAQPPARRPQRQQQLSTDEAIDYSTLEVRQLGDIYEGLLGAHLEIDSGRLALKNEKGENHRQGIYYTPDWVVCYLVRETLAPLLTRIEQTTAVQRARAARSDEKKRDNSFAHAVLQLNIVDPAMGSGHFLVRAVEWLAGEIVRHPTTRRMTAPVIAQGERRRSRDEIVGAGLIPVAPGLSQERAEIAYWRRRIVEACIYGVDLNPLAVELTKLSLWLTCIAIDEPLNFLDHHLRSGNSLLFARPDEINRLPFSEEHFPLGNRPTELLAAAISGTLQIEVEASTEMQVIEEKENLWRKVRDKLQPFWTVGDLWLAVLNGLALNDLDYQTWAKSLLDPESLTADESQHAKKLTRSLHEEFERIRAAFTPFHWHFEFPNVFFADDGKPLAGDEAGFDAVLGNPPYISTHTSSEEVWRAALDRRSGFLEDLYLHFTELGFQILKRSGRFGFIVSDTFFTLASKLRMRETLQTNTLTHLGQCDPFEATVDAAIFVAEKNGPPPDHEIFFVQARPRKNEHGQSTKPEKDLPELPSLGAIEWNGETTFVESIGATIRHGNFRSVRFHSLPLALPLAAHKRAFFEPRLQTLALFDRYSDKVKALVDEWWDKIEDSKKFSQNLALIREYHRTLKPGRVTLVGLIAEGGQGMRTADNARFLGYLEGSPQAKEVEAAAREWSERWVKNTRVKPRFIELLKANGGDPARPTWNRAAWETAVGHLRREFPPKDLGLGRMALYRIVSKNLVANQSDFQFTFQQRKKELLAQWRNEEELTDFWESQFKLQPAPVKVEKWRKGKDIGDAEFCELCDALLRWFNAENKRRRETGRRSVPRDALKLRSGESYLDPADAPRIATIYNGLSGRGVFVPFRKGDPEGSRWIDNEPLYIDWSSQAVDWLSNDPSARWQGMRFFLKEGVTWSLHANHVPVKCRLQPACVFDASGSRLTPVVSKLSPRAFVAIVNSNVFSFFLRKFIKHNQDVEVNDMRAMPIVIPTDTQLRILEDLAAHAIETRRAIFNGQTPANDLIAFVRDVSRSLMSGAPQYLKPNAQMVLLETAQDCLDTIQLAVNWEAEKVYGVEALGPFDEF